eukprot:scaffold3728_cov147-Skeletonema_marinoi.AAC.3
MQQQQQPPSRGSQNQNPTCSRSRRDRGDVPYNLTCYGDHFLALQLRGQVAAVILVASTCSMTMLPKTKTIN